MHHIQPLLPNRPIHGSVQKLNAEGRQRVQEHMNLAARLAWKHFQYYARAIPFDELSAEAMVALTYAASLYQDHRGVPFGAYATMVIRHRLAQKTMAQQRRPQSIPFSEWQGIDDSERSSMRFEIEDSFDDPCQHRAEVKELVEHIQNGIPARWFTVLQMYYLEGRTFKEIGEVVGVSKQRIRQLLVKAIQRARTLPQLQNV